MGVSERVNGNILCNQVLEVDHPESHAPDCPCAFFLARIFHKMYISLDFHLNHLRKGKIYKLIQGWKIYLTIIDNYVFHSIIYQTHV